MLTRHERVTVTIEGLGRVLELGVFDSFNGGAKKSETIKHRAGNMSDQEAVGSVPSRDDFTTGRRYKLERDHQFRRLLDELVGIGRVTAVRQKLNPDKSPFGDPDTYTGILSGFVMPDHDSDEAAKAMFTLEVNADERIS
jgi:hypothetical protein